MSSTVQARNEDVRRVQLGAALGAVGVVGASLDAFATVFSAELAEVMSVTTGGDADHLAVETVFRRFDDVLGWLEGLHDVFDLPLDTSMAAEALALRFGREGGTVSMREWREHSVPGLSVGFYGQLAASDVYDALRSAGVAAQALLDWDSLVHTLPASNPVGLRLHLDTPTATPTFTVDLACPMAKADLADTGIRLEAAMTQLGVSQGQQNWQRATLGVMAPREENNLVIRTTLTRESLQNRLRISYPQVPARMAMKLLLQFTQQSDVPRRLGALSAAAGGEDDAVDLLHVTAWDQEPPRIDVEWFKRGVSL